MPDAREVVLARIRAGIAVKPAPDAGSPREYQRDGDRGEAGRVEMLLERLREYDAHIHSADRENVAETVTNICRGRTLGSIAVPEGFPAEWLPSGNGLVHERDLDRHPLAEIEAVLTVCTVAIAHTGTIVLHHGAGEGARRLTLLPDSHICIVRTEQVVETVPEAFDRLAAFAKDPLTFISGPSATADIEMTRIRGVHGPRFLDVVLVR